MGIKERDKKNHVALESYKKIDMQDQLNKLLYSSVPGLYVDSDLIRAALDRKR